MIEYVERNKVLAEEEFFGEHATWDHPITDGCMAVRSDFIMNIPAADVAPVVHGKWIVHKWSDDDDWGYIDYKTITCSNCGYRQEWSSLDKGRYIKESLYCPECGAKMDGE